MFIYKLAKNSGGLKECLETEKDISFMEYLSIRRLYKFYGYDERIKAERYLNTDLEYPWLHIYYAEIKEE